MSTKDSIYQLKITLHGSKPPIWRRVLIAGDASLMQLHCVIQMTMGWEDAHLHMFDIDGTRYSAPMPFDDDHLRELGAKNTRTTHLYELFPQEGAKFRYDYDFGDSWEHQILVEKILPPDPDYTDPVCIKGKRACPPEDIGGLWGFYDFVEAMQNPDHEEHANYRE